jgi:hypothetical protein
MVSIEDFDRVLKTMRDAERWHRQDIRNMLAGYGDRDIDLAIWSAMQACEEDVRDPIVWGPVPKFPGTYRRLDPGQTVNRARRQRQSGVRKMLRAARKLIVAAEKYVDEKDRERVEREASRTLERARYRARKT